MAEYIHLYGNIAMYRVKVETIANHFSLYHSEPPYGIEDLIDHMKNNMDFDELEAEICCEIAEDYNDFCNWEYKII